MISAQQLAKIQAQVQLESMNEIHESFMATMPEGLQLVNLDAVMAEPVNLAKKVAIKPKAKAAAPKKADPLDKEPYFQVSKAIYQDSVSRINEEFGLRKEWIDEYAVDKKLETSFLSGWKRDAMDMLNHSSISPAARAEVKAYIKED